MCTFCVIHAGLAVYSLFTYTARITSIFCTTLLYLRHNKKKTDIVIKIRIVKCIISQCAVFRNFTVKTVFSIRAMLNAIYPHA